MLKYDGAWINKLSVITHTLFHGGYVRDAFTKDQYAAFIFSYVFELSFVHIFDN